jgi:long-chain acyl-CoA synthetase
VTATLPGWYDSRDVMSRDADAFFYFIGRSEDMFNSGRETSIPAEVETGTEATSEQALLAALADEIKYNESVTFVVPRGTAEIREDDINAWFIGRAAPKMDGLCHQALVRR